MKEIHVNIGSWRWVAAVGMICFTVVLLSRIWIPYLQDRDHVQLVLQTSEIMQKNVPVAMKKAMGGMEYPLRKKVKVDDE